MSAAPRRDVYVGLMSGTSLDGISAAVVHFEPLESSAPKPGKGAARLEPKLLAFNSTAYDSEQG